jgi:hypothetical protein
LKSYLEYLSNEPNTKINNNSAPIVNFLARELLEFLNFDEKLIDEIMDF